jgi:hypothetical protein
MTLYPPFGTLAPTRLWQEQTRALLRGRAARVPRLHSIAGQLATFVRGSNATSIGSTGDVLYVAPQQPRYHWVDQNADRVRETWGLLLEPAATNRVRQSQALGTTPWVTSNLTATEGWRTCGYLTLTRCVDATAGAVGSVYQDLNTLFSGNGVKGFSIVLAPGETSAPSGGDVVLRDVTASADRLSWTVTWNSDGSPNVGTNVGAYYGAQPLANGAWRLYGATTSGVLAANNHRVTLRPARTASEQGIWLVGAVQVEDTTVPTSYIPTTTSAGTRAADVLTYAWNTAWVPRESLLTLRCAWFAPHMDAGVAPSATSALWTIGVGNQYVGLERHTDNTVRARAVNSAETGHNALVDTAGNGAVHECVAWARWTAGGPSVKVAVNGSEGAWSSALPTVWATWPTNSVVQLGGVNGSVVHPVCITEWAIFAGEVPLLDATTWL